MSQIDKLGLFVEELKAALPASLAIAQDLDTNALQGQLEQQVDVLFREKYRKIEGEVAERMKNLEKSVSAKVADVNAFQSTEQDHLQRLMQQLKDQLTQQKRLIAEISDSVARKKDSAVQARYELEQQLSELQGKVAELQERTKQSEERAIGKKARAKLTNPSIEIVDSRYYFTVLCTNLKNYDLANLSLRFTGDADYQVQWILVNKEYLQYVPGRAEAILYIDEPQLPPNTHFSVILTQQFFTDGTSEAISEPIDYQSR